MEAMAVMYRTPTLRSATYRWMGRSRNGSVNCVPSGMTAARIRAGTTVTIGASTKISL